MSPYRDTRPYVGLSATTPQWEPGSRILPPVSLPSARVASPAATAAAEPPLEPPGTRIGSHGLRVGPYPEFSVLLPNANSSQLVLPSRIAPASRSRTVTVASYGGRNPLRIRED